MFFYYLSVDFIGHIQKTLACLTEEEKTAMYNPVLDSTTIYTGVQPGPKSQLPIAVSSRLTIAAANMQSVNHHPFWEQCGLVDNPACGR